VGAPARPGRGGGHDADLGERPDAGHRRGGL
jgi:hypothetical protein